MTNDDTARLPEIDADLRDRFKQDVKNRKGTTHGHYRTELENALEAYLDASKGGDTDDRLRRIENAVEDLADTMVELSDDESGKTKTHETVGTESKNKLERIKERIGREAADAKSVHESVVNRAIEDVAGGSDPTMRKYKRMLKERHHAFENPHPEQKTWFVDEEAFVKVVNHNLPEYTSDVASEYGEDWWDDALSNHAEDEGDTHDRTFQ